MYVYMCVCTCVFVCMYVCICAHVWVHNMYACMFFQCVYLYMYVCICWHVYVCMYMCICVYVCMNVSACMCGCFIASGALCFANADEMRFYLQTLIFLNFIDSAADAEVHQSPWHQVCIYLYWQLSEVVIRD